MVNEYLSIDTRVDLHVNYLNVGHSVIQSKNGDFYVFWVLKDNYDRICIQKFTKNLNKINSLSFISSVGPVPDNKVKAIRLNNGKVVVLYSIYSNGFITWGCKLFDENSNTFSDEITYGMPLTNIYVYEICSLINNLFVIITFYTRYDNGKIRSSAIIYDGNGNFKKAMDLSNLPENQGDQGQSCVGLSNGNLLIAFSYKDDSGIGIIYKVWDMNYNIILAETLINTTVNNNQQYPSFAVNSNDEVIVCWESNQTNNFIIYCRIKDSIGNSIKEEFSITKKSDQRFPKSFISDQLNFLVCWEGYQTSLANYITICSIVDNKGDFIVQDFYQYQIGIYKKRPAIVQLYNKQYIIVGESVTNNKLLGIFMDSYYGFQLANSIFTNNQIEAYINRLNNGGFIITWTCISACETANGARGQLFDKDGKKVGKEFPVNKFTDNDQDKCKSATLSDNNIFIYWESKEQDKSTSGLINTGIYGKIISQDGITIKEEYLLNTSIFDTQYKANMIAHSNGFSVLTYSSKHFRCIGSTCNFTVWGKFFNNDGSVKKDEFMLNLRDSGNQDNSFPCFLKDDRILFIWTSDSSQDGNGIGIFGRISDLTGTFINTTDVQINKLISGDQINPRCVGLNLNRFAVVYESGSDILVRIFNSDWTVFKDEFTVNTFTTGVQQNPAIYGLSDGKFIVGWESNAQDESLLGIFYQVFDSEGNPSGKETQANSFTYQDQKEISFTQLTSGTVALAFTSYGDSDGFGVYYEFILNCQDGRFLDPEYNYRCSPCNFMCGTCNEKSSCLICGINYNLLEGTTTCVSKCPNGTVNLNNICKKCSNLCKTCNLAIDNCTSCNTGFSLAQNSINDNICLNSFTGYFLPSGLTYYLKCDASCSTCTTTSTNCQSCNSLSYYYPKVDATSTCILKTSSPDGYYFNSISNQHEKCDISCITCSNNSNNCLLCNNSGGYYNSDDVPNTCSKAASNGYVLDITLKKYVKCDFSCSSCIDTKIKCTKCNQDFFYFVKVDEINSCFLNQNSPSGYFFNQSTNVHEKCNVNCLKCINNADNCTICNIEKGYYNVVNKPNICLNYTPEGYFLNSKFSQYDICDISCSKCSETYKNCNQCNILLSY